MIKPHDLTEMDTDVSSILKFNGHAETVQKILDVVKKSAYGVDFIIWGMENQSKIHYAMPLRHMLGDALIYLKEYHEIALKNKKDKNFDSTDEFLSKFKKTDRLHPVISLCVYYGEEEWDGPLKLSDMLDYPEKIASYIADYPIHLVQLRKDEHLKFHDFDVDSLFRLVRYIYTDNYSLIQQYYQNQDISTELGLVIGAITQTQQLINYSLEASQKGGKINMCNAMQRFVNHCQEEARLKGHREGHLEGRLEGRLEGLINSIELCKEFDCSQEVTVEKILSKFSLSEEEAVEYGRKYW